MIHHPSLATSFPIVALQFAAPQPYPIDLISPQSDGMEEAYFHQVSFGITRRKIGIRFLLNFRAYMYSNGMEWSLEFYFEIQAERDSFATLS